MTIKYYWGWATYFPPRHLFAPPYLPQRLLEGVMFEGPNLDGYIIAQYVKKHFISKKGGKRMFDDMQKGRRVLPQDKYEFLRPTLLTEGLMAFGFACGYRWLPILEGLFRKHGVISLTNRSISL
jgi:hypothetical protein